jgi:general secretion pathway protein K
VVLWLSAALSAIAFSVASTVRSETGRVTSSVDRLKAYYLATGAIERALLYMQWGEGQRNPDGTPRYYAAGMPRLEFQFPSGGVTVEVIPETAKMNLNSSPPEDLYNLLLVLGAEPERAREITAGILDWRTPQPLGEPTMFDQLYLSQNPSFRSRHASFEEIEELLLIQGMTPELFYGTYGHDAQGRLMPHRALKDCVSVYGATSGFDANTADPAVLAAIGLPPDVVDALVRARRVRPFRNAGELAAFLEDAPGTNRLTVGGSTIFTLRATARPRVQDGKLSDARWSAAVLFKFLDSRFFTEPYHVLRWYDNVWVD